MRILIFLLGIGTVAYGQTLSLPQAIQQGLAKNRWLKAEQEKLKSVRGQSLQLLSPTAPTVSLEEEYIPLGAGVNSFEEKKITVSQDFDLPHIVWQKVRQQSAEKRAGELEYQWSVQELSYQITIAYYQVQRQQMSLRLAEENSLLMDELAAKIEARVQAGETLPLEAMSARVQKSQVRNLCERQRKSLLTRIEEMNALLGEEDLDKSWALTDSLASSSPPVLLDSLLASVPQRHPILRSMQYQIRSAAQRAGLAWSSFWPDVKISYSRQTLEKNNRFYGFSVGLALPLWFMFDQKGKIQETTAQLNMAQYAYQSMLTGQLQKIRAAFREYQNALREALFYQTELLPQAEEAYRLAAAGYEAGDLSLLECLQIRQTLNTAKEGNVESLYNFKAALADLKLAAGITL